MKTKLCFKCKSRKPLSSFYKHPQMGDGHLGKCKTCTKSDVMARRWLKISYYRAYDRKRFADDPERREYQRKSGAALRKKYPGKTRARYAVHNAVRDGRLFKKPCSVCGDKRVESHHPDYRKPLDVVWLCRKHHNEAHHRHEMRKP